MTTSGSTTGGSSTSAAYTAPDVRAAIAETNRRFEAAMAAGDGRRVAEETYTRDARVMPPGAPTVVGRDAIAEFWAGAIAQMGIRGVALRTVELQPMGDGAVEIGEATLTLADGAEAVAKYVVAWRSEEGRWRIHVDIWNMDA